jgi:hypothetical protein
MSMMKMSRKTGDGTQKKLMSLQFILEPMRSHRVFLENYSHGWMW